jgi:hypothetical protein
MAFNRKVGRLVVVRGLELTLNRYIVRPARITVVGVGTTVTAKVLGPSGTTYAALPQWTAAATTLGWKRA